VSVNCVAPCRRFGGNHRNIRDDIMERLLELFRHVIYRHPKVAGMNDMNPVGTWPRIPNPLPGRVGKSSRHRSLDPLSACVKRENQVNLTCFLFDDHHGSKISKLFKSRHAQPGL
jgi:hypothetical protein